MRCLPFWRRKPKHDRDREGIEESRRLLANVRAQEPRVAHIREHTERLMRENHFGERIARALGEH